MWRSEFANFHCDDSNLVSGSYPNTHVLSPVIIDFIKIKSLETRFFSSKHTSMRYSTWSFFDNFYINFATTLFIANSSIKIEWQKPINMLTSLATSLTVNHRSFLIFFLEQKQWYYLLSILKHTHNDGHLQWKFQPPLIRLNKSKVTQRPNETSIKANLKVSVAFLPI